MNNRSNKIVEESDLLSHAISQDANAPFHFLLSSFGVVGRQIQCNHGCNYFAN